MWAAWRTTAMPVLPVKKSPKKGTKRPKRVNEWPSVARRIFVRLLKPTVHRLLMTKVAAKSLELALFCKKKIVELGAGWPDVPSPKTLGHKKRDDDNNKTTPEKKSSPEKKRVGFFRRNKQSEVKEEAAHAEGIFNSALRKRRPARLITKKKRLGCTH